MYYFVAFSFEIITYESEVHVIYLITAHNISGPIYFKFLELAQSLHTSQKKTGMLSNESQSNASNYISGVAFRL